MIKRHVSAVLRISDSFSGAVMKPSSLLFRLDGENIAPQYRDGGYFVFCDIYGEHEIEIYAAHYIGERLRLDCAEDKTLRTPVKLRPDRSYPVPSGAHAFTLKAKSPLYIAAPDAEREIKTAQDKISPSDISCKIYMKNRAALAAFPQEVILCGDRPEAACAVDMTNGELLFSAPLKNPHVRAEFIRPAQLCTPRDGEIYVLSRAASLIIFDPRSGKLSEVK